MNYNGFSGTVYTGNDVQIAAVASSLSVNPRPVLSEPMVNAARDKTYNYTLERIYMPKIKEGVILTGIRPEIVVALIVAAPIFKEHGRDLVVTSALEGKHKAGSAHYTGRAVDLRIWNLDSPKETVVDLKKALGENYDVILHDTHIHVEFDPRGG